MVEKTKTERNGLNTLWEVYPGSQWWRHKPTLLDQAAAPGAVDTLLLFSIYQSYSVWTLCIRVASY